MAAYGAQAVDNPDVFVGRNIASAYEPYPLATGSNYTSLAPASNAFIRWLQPDSCSFKSLYMVASLNAGAPAATSQASTGSEGYSYAFTGMIASRQDYSGNSSNLSVVATGSFGMTGSMGYSSTSQRFGLSWLTDSTGGTSNFTTTSADAGWSAFASGPRLVAMPIATMLPPGEFFFIWQHSSSSATSNSNVTLMSISHLQQLWQASNATLGVLGASATTAAPWGPNVIGGIGTSGLSTSGTFASSVFNSTGLRQIWFAMSNA